MERMIPGLGLVKVNAQEVKGNSGPARANRDFACFPTLTPEGIYLGTGEVVIIPLLVHNPVVQIRPDYNLYFTPGQGMTILREAKPVRSWGLGIPYRFRKRIQSLTNLFGSDPRNSVNYFRLDDPTIYFNLHVYGVGREGWHHQTEEVFDLIESTFRTS